KHELGQAQINGVPKRVVVFDYGLLDIVDAVGGNVVGVVKDNLPQSLKKFNDKKYTNIGTLFEPNYETLIKLKPDLILISGRQEKVYKELNKIAPTIYLTVDGPTYMNDLKKNSLLIGDIFNKKSVVEGKLASIDKSIKSLNKKTTNNNAMFLLVNGNALSVYGKGSRFDMLYSVFGFKSADTNIPVDNHGNKVSYEYILSKNPDYLFVLDRSKLIDSKITAKETLDNNLIKSTKAYKNKKIINLNLENWYLASGGLTVTENIIKEIKTSVK
ncbi:MAG: ABC transporter substrate-binding protein, partial [Fusobacteriaceae bacterium]|nr:ABC transporter substrate-binding protein [Fusobacteriaceae bacterium]